MRNFEFLEEKLGYTSNCPVKMWTKAKLTFTLSDHIKAMNGIESRLEEDVIDETPEAYKNFNSVMNAQSDLIEIVTKLRPVICVKG